jgi:pyruvate ferredoxin oxidoreductase beta subunit
VRFTPGHRTCAGCGIPTVVRAVLAATDKPVIVSNATGCLEVASTMDPFTNWNVPYIHNAFENAAATLSGVETAYRALKKKGKIKDDIKFVAFGGDGGTYDIGLQSLSGTLERGHDIVYVCYDNEGYMNTGGQRSSASPIGSSTTTDPAGRVRPGKQEFQKNFTEIAVAHNIPYVAQATIGNWADMMKKAEKAFNVKGPAVLNILTPCILFWKVPTDSAVQISKLAYETNFWPLYEVENGKYTLNYNPQSRKPIIEWIKPQGRYAHLLLPENKALLEKIQRYYDDEFEKLKKKCGVN